MGGALGLLLGSWTSHALVFLARDAAALCRTTSRAKCCTDRAMEMTSTVLRTTAVAREPIAGQV